MIQTGMAVEGLKVRSPDGDGIIEKILNPDVVRIRYDTGKIGKFDLSELVLLEPQTAGHSADFVPEAAQ